MEIDDSRGGVDSAAGVSRGASFGQQRLWFLDQLRPGTPDYLLPLALRIRGDLDTGALLGALTAVVERHEILRTTYRQDGGTLVQRISPDARFPFDQSDVTGTPEGAREERFARLIEDELRLPIDLGRQPPLRAVLARADAGDHLLLVVVHHIAFDGMSWNLLGAELAAGYRERTGGAPAGLGPLSVQYADFADWQSRRLTDRKLATGLDHWRTRLAALTSLELPTDRPRPAVWDGAGDAVRFELPAEVMAAVELLARRHRATRFMVLLAAFQAVLARFSGQQDIAVGTPVAGRGLPEAERLIGLFVNTVVLRGDLTGEPSFRTLLGRVKADALSALSHAETPFELVVDELAPERDLARNPLFQVSFSLRTAPPEPIALPGLDCELVRTPLTGSPFDLVLDTDVLPDGRLNARLQYATALFDRATAQRLADAFRLLLDAVLVDPDLPLHRVGLLTDQDRQAVVEKFNDTAVPMPERTLHELFAEQVARTPGAVALRCAEQELTYRRLDRRANHLAHRLRAHGVGPESLVGVSLRRGPELVVALLAVLKAGGGYLPLAPDHPPLRRGRLLTRAGAELLIADGEPVAGWSGTVLAVEEGEREAAPGSGAGPDNLAYVIYTSGSTGEPKGVVVTHRNVVNYVLWSARTYLSDGAGTPLYSSVAFDLPVTSIFPALLTGAPVTLTPDDGTPGLDGLVQLLTRDRFDLLKLTPTHLGPLGRELSPAALRTGAPHLAVGGEQLTGAMLEPWRRHAPDTVVFNEYGPTETTVGCATLALLAHELDPGPMGIGVPIDNTTLYVLDAELDPVLPGAVGELYIGGVQVARGYHGRGDLTAERFVPDPYAAVPGARFYRSGDLVRHRSDGLLEFISRVDTQIKVAGFRVEPAEVEAALAEHPDVREAAVSAHGTGDAARLVAYLVPAGEQAPQVAEVRAHLERLLPAHLVPAFYVALPELPFTTSGKVDRKALPDPGGARLVPTAHRVAPRTPLEQAVAAVWCELLELAEVGVDDDFFALGGNSLLATRLAFRLRQVVSAEVPLAEVFAARTVARLAEVLGAVADARQAPITAGGADGPLPLSFAQERLWFLDRLAPGATDYLVPIALRLRGPLDPSKLTAALDGLASRHAVLRTRYEEHDGEPVQLVDPDARIPVAERAVTEEEALRLIRADLEVPFDLSAGAPVRAMLLHVGDDDCILLLTLHHIVSDGWSVEVLADELARNYAGEAVEPLPVQYPDFARWQREHAATAEFAAPLAHWRKRLTGLPPLELPTDHRRPRLRDPRGDRLAVELPAGVGSAVEELARRNGATPFMVLLAAFYTLLGRWSGQQDLAVGTAVSGRTRSETAPLIGFFANTLVLRGDLGGHPSFTALLGRVREMALDAYGHADVPFERIVEELMPERDLSRNPLFQVMFELRPPRGEVFALPGLRVEQLAVSWPVAKFDLMLSVQPQAEGVLRCVFEYATALFDRGTVQRMAEYYGRLLAALVREPDLPIEDVEAQGGAERELLVRGWSDTTVERPARCLPELFAEQAARTPDAPAVVFGGHTLSYADLDARATRLAHHLRALGVRAETPVAVCLRRDADLVTALLAVLRAGGTYVPVDPAHPAHRRAYVLADSGAALLVSQSWIRDELPGAGTRLLLLDEDRELIDRQPDAGPPPLDAASAAYLMYTSGSTGRPKGVVISHAAIRNRVLWTVREHGLGPADRVLQKTTVGFDASVWEFLAPLVCGAAVVVAANDVPRDPAAMVRAVADHRVTVLQLVPSVLRMLVQQPELRDCATLRLVFCAGEPLPVELSDRLLGMLPVTLVNTYGPTECAIDVTSWRYDGREAGENVAIGHPIDNTRILVLDPGGGLVPVGVPGELCVAGDGLARGYLGRGDLTAERFVPNPHPAAPGERIYRTGDRVRRRADGVLDYLGRLDRQVKLRGIRIEPSEIEAVLCEHPSVAAAAVGVYGEQQLVGHVVPAGDLEPDPAALRAHLASRLPDPMVPTVLRVLAALPLTASGKVDRDALPGLDGLDEAGGYLVPRDAAEQTVAEVFAELLGRERVGVLDDFFALGGHSLLATRLVFRLRAAFGVEVPVAEVFSRRTVAALAELATAPGTPATDPAGAVVPVPRGGALPLSSAQRRMWFLDQLEPGSSEYLVPLVLRLRGPLHTRALTAALDDLTSRHEGLRTRYLAPGGEPAQVIDPPTALGAVPVDLSGLPAGEAAARAGELVRAETARPFRLDQEPPLRALLVKVSEEEHLLTLTAHHIAVDAWSVDLITRDLGLLYRARVAGGTPPPPSRIQYADFAAWQDRWSRGGLPQTQLAHWRERLGGLTPLELPTDRPRPAVRDPRGDLLAVAVPGELAEAVAELARSQAVTPFVVLLAAFDVLLARYTRQTDVSVGTPTAGRTRPEVEEVVGSFINTVVLRADLDGDPSFAALLRRVHLDVVAAYSHQDLPFERLVDDLQPERDLSRNPLFQVMFELQHAQSTPLRLDGLTVERVPSPWRTAKFDLTLSLGRRADGSLHGLFEYATALFDRATVERMAGHYLSLLRSVTRQPDAPLSRLAMLTEAERARVVHGWNPAGAEPPPACVPALFEQRAAETPGAVAVAFGPASLTFAELNARANQLAHHLRDLGVDAERPVAVCMERGVEVVVALLAVLKAGGVYVPIDPEHPAERLAFMLGDLDAGAVLTTGTFAERLSAVARCPLVLPDTQAEHIAGLPDRDLPAQAGPDQLAYVIYTSGSTGQPKGVLIQHGSYAHHCRVIAESYGIVPGDRAVLLSALTFDVAMDQIAATLIAGATVVVADPLFWSPAELPERVADHGITVMEITPAYYREVIRQVRPGDERLRGLKLMNVGSDVVTVDDARAWAATGLPGRFLCNYGPTEATVTCVLHPVPTAPPGRGEAALPIGRPVPGTRAYVLDGDGEPTPVGVPGELHLAGVRLARGYHRRPGLTAEKFVPDPFGELPGGRLYRTGDLVRYLADGTIEFLGRIDQQVKLRGFRIELGEIEAVLAQHPALRAVAVVARDVQPGDRRLVAYLVPHGTTGPDVAEVRDWAGERLPSYMLPSLWMPLADLPLTSSKKVDRKALPQPVVDREFLERPFEAPRDPTEEIVAEVWADVLGIERIGVNDDVFVLGAHSLLATRVLARLVSVFDVDLPLRCLFEATTVAGLSQAVMEALEAQVAALTDEEVAALLARE
ncbi:non-ribosomal peptide synthetase [Streptacidiphilus sp. P02-A3a]|uniref:non-ribosomal peptide synthetase n=1 Tax=Streptacidiphilus sp. P02-A3a TaxID=2704468 RepID=UPI0015FBAACF|nr:non-ribosomal peptide synthetase [Streptacidiphilus sp. P02-A3a]QMU71796.1 amino acid adenylation domain-containing protein [Streptacidiphilus sp. P02-A3a]